MEFLLSFSISFFKKSNSSSLRLDFLVNSSIIPWSFFSFSLISYSISLMYSSVWSFSCYLFSSILIISSLSRLKLLKFLMICSSFIIVVLLSSYIYPFNLSSWSAYYLPRPSSSLAFPSNLFFSYSILLNFLLYASSWASVSLLYWSATPLILLNSICSSSVWYSSYLIIYWALAFSDFMRFNSFNRSLNWFSSSLALAANYLLSYSSCLVFLSTSLRALYLICFYVYNSLKRSLTFCSLSKYLES